MRVRAGLMTAGLGLVLATVPPAAAQETPKQGGMLTYMIPADAPPSLDGHRETTYATVHTAAPFSDHPPSVVRQGLEDQPEPLPQSGLAHRVARQIGRLRG